MSQEASLEVVILAAGLGKRMYSSLPKVLHCLGGQRLLERVVKTAQRLSPSRIDVICGHEFEMLRDYLHPFNVNCIYQEQQLGTGHAAAQALPYLSENSRVLILNGDVPLISQATLEALISNTPLKAVGLLTMMLDNPAGYGRIVRNQEHQIVSIIEDKDATESELQIKEVNTGVFLVPASLLKTYLPALQNHNAQQEYYLTDLIRLSTENGIKIQSVLTSNPMEVQGINTRAELITLERYFQRQQANNLLLKGVTIMDPNRFDLRGELIVGKDVSIDVDVILEGKVVLGEGVKIGPYTLLKNVSLGAHTEIRAHSVIEDTVIGERCLVGPFARLRPETVLDNEVKIGNFVEIKKSYVGKGSKVPHLSYLGDATVGTDSNIGAGTITCNYDGKNKHKTIIGDRVFIGSDTQLIAPVEIGNDATIAAGSTVKKNAPAAQLTVTQQLAQRTINGWKPPKKSKEST